MCSQYALMLTGGALAHLFQISGEDFPSDKFELAQRVLPHTKAPVLFLEKSKKNLELMRFSLIPHWSKEEKVKFATHNARLETVDEKPSFRIPFVKKHCIVPMTGFIEAIYLNELAGNMVEFKAKEQGILYAAGIWDEWLNKNSGEILRSFTILTSDPTTYVDKVGHDRSPVFLAAATAMKWLELENTPAPKLKEFLLTSRIEPELEASIDRPLKEGWQKRIPV